MQNNFKKINTIMKKYTPIIIENPNAICFKNGISAWYDIPTILKDIIVRFGLKTELALEFGVGCAYSTTALANYFDKVIGVDTFRMNIKNLNPNKPSNYNEIKEFVKDFLNIELVESLFEDYIKNDKNTSYDMIHIDIIHEYDPTYMCGDWACQKSNCVIFHDTTTFPEVMRAVNDLSVKNNFEFFNYNRSNGLGILVKKSDEGSDQGGSPK